MIKSIDHIVLTTYNLKACIQFYTEVLQLKMIHFQHQRIAFQFGQQKINVHEYGHEIEPKAHSPVPGSLDICLVADQPLENVLQHLESKNIKLVEGPVPRTGACGPITSVYIRDPDLNLIEIAFYGQ